MVSPSTITMMRLLGTDSDFNQESPHEQQQNILLSRIVSNVVCLFYVRKGTSNCVQEKLNEAVMVLNKSLQVRMLLVLIWRYWMLMA